MGKRRHKRYRQLFSSRYGVARSDIEGCPENAGQPTHQALIWGRTRHVLRLRSALREFFPAALEAFEDLAAPGALELLAKAPITSSSLN